jgi:hypothetical protein
MTPLPPPTLDPPPAPPPERSGVAGRWNGVSRRTRWIGGGVAVVVALGAIGALSDRSDDDTIRTAGPAATVERQVEPDPAPTGLPDRPSTSPAPATTTPATRPAIAPRASTTLPPPPTVPPPPGSLAALDVLASIPIARETPEGYQRELFAYGSPVDEFGCRTRALVLIRDSLTPAQIDRVGCAVVAGDWRSPYDGVVWQDPGEVQIDHVVALKEAWDSGANAWDAARLSAFANDVDDPRTLRVVTGDVNAAKGDKDPVNWLPPDPAAVCPYLADWVAIKARWGLSMDESEYGRVRNLLTDRCPGQTVSPWEPVVPAAPTAPVAPPIPAPPAAPG